MRKSTAKPRKKFVWKRPEIEGPKWRMFTSLSGHMPQISLRTQSLFNLCRICWSDAQLDRVAASVLTRKEVSEQGLDIRTFDVEAPKPSTDLRMVSYDFKEIQPRPGYAYAPIAAYNEKEGIIYVLDVKDALKALEALGVDPTQKKIKIKKENMENWK